MLKLECPNCKSCFTVEDWNKSLGIREEPIPLGIHQEDWDMYAASHDGRIDCPDCGDVAIYEDMMPV